MKIQQEFKDRYNQARTYHQLGWVAREEKDYAASLGYYAAALEIFTEFKDNYNLEKTLGNLAVLMQVKAWDAAAAIQHLDTKEETKTALFTILEKVKKEKKKKKKKEMY